MPEAGGQPTALVRNFGWRETDTVDVLLKLCGVGANTQQHLCGLGHDDSSNSTVVTIGKQLGGRRAARFAKQHRHHRACVEQKDGAVAQSSSAASR